MGSWKPLLVTCVLAILSSVIGFGLYRFSVTAIEQKGIRFSGAAAIAIAAYLGLSRLYLSLSSQEISQHDDIARRVRDAELQYDICREQEQSFACREPADRLRTECGALIEP